MFSNRKFSRALAAFSLFPALNAAAMDLVRQETRTDEAVAQYDVSGRGVTVAVLDRGIDYTHPDFRNSDGTTRIKYILDMTGQQVCSPGDPPPIEYTEAQINAALAGGPPLPFRDAVGHGTVTAGIAAGNGSAAAGGKYRGIAPNADLIVVKITSEGAPAHDGQPAEAPFQGCIEDALDWLDDKITELDQPCVALINSGTQWGPMDGTSAVCRQIDEIFGRDRPGRVYIAPSGDEGGFDNHARDTYTQSADTIVTTIKAGGGTSFASMWYSGDLPAEITITFSDGTTVGPVGPSSSIDQDGVTIFQYAPGAAFYPWQSNGPDRAVWIRITGHSATGTVRIRATGVAPAPGVFDLYGSPDNAFRMTSHLTPGRLTDYATSYSALVAGAHVIRTSYVDIDGFLRFVDTEGDVGELWAHSSGGPTRDGRLHGVDLTAPGHNCFAAYAPDSYWGSLRFNLIHDGEGLYGRAGATSGSAPIVLGAAALMLESNPTLTGAQVRQILRDTAHRDDDTGPSPSADWGFGKLDVLAALDAVCALGRPGDFDGDCDVDLVDFGQFQICFTGSGGTAAPGCSPADFDGDNDIDLIDFGEFQLAFTGS